MKTLTTSCFVLMLVINCALGQFTIVSVIDDSLKVATSWLEEGVSEAELKTNISISNKVVALSIEDEEGAEEQLCQALYDSLMLIFDLTAGGWTYARNKADTHGIPYVHGQVSIYPWIAGADELLQSRNATDAALIFSEEALLDQALYYLVEGSVVRVIVLTGIDVNTTAKLKKMRPAPAHYVIFGSPASVTQMFSTAVSNGLVTRDSRWTLVTTSSTTIPFENAIIPGNTMVTTLSPREELCCIARATEPPRCRCEADDIPKFLTKNMILSIARTFKVDRTASRQIDCNSSAATSSPEPTFQATFTQEINQWTGVSWIANKKQVRPEFTLDITARNKTQNNGIGTWGYRDGLQLNPNFVNAPIRRYIKVGTISSRPWMYEKKQEPRATTHSPQYEGYCVELTDRFSSEMLFDFDFVFPKDGKYGARMPNGTWNGLVEDLVKGETDIIVAPLTMTSEREEVIDFVAPYFDQSGISIVIRKREREESLFKFMTVLKAEVWVSIVAALIVTGVMIWFLDKYSPYSAQNNADSDQFRKFTLKESFWFALTSFTPQGGGEAPKALSGRTLVAAYWLFVVLMLATFTANLAAFLTVERMQTPVSSLEELAGQSKIKYTVLIGSSVYQYFYNMAAAEEELYRVWKELTLNSTTDQSKYRVWDYPIKEQYTHILQVIDKTGPVTTVEEGLQKVLDSKDGEFAFIHDAAELRYEVYHNCYLTEVGEPFAEQPYAIAVQQGSHLQDDISRTILELQKGRYFEALIAKYWNSSERGDCPNEDDSEGITLQSLGGVFIATLIGLVLALLALAAEVMYYRRIPDKTETPMKGKMKIGRKGLNTVSRISVSPAF